MRTFVSVLGGAVLLAGCGSGTPGVTDPSAPGELLAAFQPPPGAVRLAEEPSGAPKSMSNPATRPMVDHLLIGTSWWTVNMTPQQAESWFAAHAPAGTAKGAGVGGSGPNVVVAESFDFPDQIGYQERSLMMGAVAYHGGALLRVDAMEVHVGALSAQDEVPPGVTRLEARVEKSVAKGGVVTSTVTDHATVTDEATVRQIAAMTNALPLLPPGVRNCPADTGGTLTLDFSTPTPAATLTLALSGCRDATLTTPQHPSGTALNAAQSGYGAEVLKLLGIRL